MGPTRELIDDLYREKVLRARRTPIEEKFLAGAELYEEAQRRSLAGLRSQNPGADEATIRVLWDRRQAILKRLRDSPA